MADPPAFSSPRMKAPKNLNRGDPHLNSLEKLILPVYLLETDDVVVVNELPEIFEFELPVFSARKEPTQRDPECSKSYIVDLHRGSGHMYPDLQCHAVPEVVEEHQSPTGVRRSWKGVFKMVVLESSWEEEGQDCSRSGGRATGHSRKKNLHR